MTNNRAQRTVGNYVEVLLNRANPQDKGSIALGTSLNLLANPLPPCKRTAITQELENKTIENTPQKGAPTSETVSNTSTHTTSAISTITQIDLEERFDQLRQELRREQDKSITKMKDKLQKDMQTALTTLLTKMQSNMLASLQPSIEATFKASMAQMTNQMSNQIMQMNASGLSSPTNSAFGPSTVEQSSSVSATQNESSTQKFP